MSPSVSFVSLGCPKNLVDSEKMLGLLAEAGCAVVAPGAAEADVLVVNTCGFLAASRDEAVEILEEAADQKRRGQIRRIVVAGCLVQRDGRTLIERVPEIDALVGVNNREDIVRAVVGREAGTKAPAAAGRLRHKGTKGTKIAPARSTPSSVLSPQSLPIAGHSDSRTLFLGEYHSQSWTDRARLRLTPRHYAYLRMSEGCNQKCTFCTIPSIRGPMHCKSVDEIVAEARELIDDGVVEINLIGQDTTSYLSEPPATIEPDTRRQRSETPVNLAGLLRTLDRVEGLGWIRLMYAYPSDFTDEMIDAIAECEHVVKYIDIPLQHINDRMLKAMHRRVTRAQTEALLRKLRDRIPAISIRTTFIAGFPGETQAQFEELRRFIEDFGFDMLGVFPYSREPETPAGRMKDQLDDRDKQDRAAALMETQQRVAFRAAAAMKGRRMSVLIDDFGRDGVYPARHHGQAPQIDSVTHVHGGEFDAGQIVQVCCTGHDGYDLLAKPVEFGLPVLHHHHARAV